MEIDIKAQKQRIAAGINKVFEHRKNFVVIGLTGRTGSGCSTAARILSTPFSDLRLPTVPNPPRTHEDRKLRIVRLWAEAHWQPFITISATALILALSLERGLNPLLELIESVSDQRVRERLQTELSPLESDIKSAFSIARRVRSSEVEPSDVAFAADVLTQEAHRALAIVKDALKSYGAAYTTIFQSLGNNVRLSGSPLSSEPSEEAIFTIPATIESVIRVIRASRTRDKGSPIYIVVDALRHPYEIRYLRERISSFYTVAVSTTDHDRRQRLHSLQLTSAEVARLDETEYPDRIAGADNYLDLIKQNIQACLELADVYISNTGIDDQSRIELTRQLVRYVSLMQHPGLVTPTAVERRMQAALTAKANSGCISRQVGAVVTDEHYSIKAMGWNDVPQGQVPCVLRNVSHLMQGNFDLDAYSEYEKSNATFKGIVLNTYGTESNNESYLGRNLSYCFKSAYNQQTEVKNQVHTRSLHAEENAFLQIAKYGGQSIAGGFLFTTASPCELCAKKAFQLGIRKIYYIDPYPGIASTHVLASGSIRPETHLFDGAIGAAYHDLYQPIMSFKDELPSLLAGDAR
jgi:dCMP deaminase